MTTPETGDYAEESIGARIKRLRREKRLTQLAISGPGVTPAQISRIESGKRQPSVKAIRRIARKLEVSPEFLETGVDITTREELELTLTDLELRMRLDPNDQTIERELGVLVKISQREGETDIAARAHSVLGMALAERGLLNDAVGHLEKAIQHPLETPCANPDAYTTLASVYCELGRPGEAADLCERALDAIQADDAGLRMVLATKLSYALSELGEHSRAAQTIEQIGDDVEAADPYSRARSHWGLGRAAAMRDDRRLALQHLRDAIALLKGTEDTVRLARSHLLFAATLLWAGKTAGVSKHLDAARELFPNHAEKIDRGMLLGYEALVAARQHRLEDALAAADEALALLKEHSSEQAAALYAKALALSGRCEYEVADAIFAHVIDMAVASALWSVAALISRDRADMLRWAGKPHESDAAAEQAQEFERRAEASRAKTSGAV